MTFGYVIVFEFDAKEKLIDVYPMKTKIRGFDYQDESEGFIKLTKYMDDKGGKLLNDIL